jgi:signal peptidase I
LRAEGSHGRWYKNSRLVTIFGYAGLIIYGPFDTVYNLLLVLLLALSIYAVIIRDAMCVARRVGEGYELRPCNKWYVYLGFAMFAIIVSAFVDEPVKDHIKQQHLHAFKIPSGSMMPTLLIGDHILVEKSTCKNGKTPQRGDIVVFVLPEDETKDFIKRVIGLQGDTIEVRTKIVYVNGTPLEDMAYTQRVDPGVIDGHMNPRDNFGPVVSPRTRILCSGTTATKVLIAVFLDLSRRQKSKARAQLSIGRGVGVGTGMSGSDGTE